jgi:hypothetical protein
MLLVGACRVDVTDGLHTPDAGRDEHAGHTSAPHDPGAHDDIGVAVADYMIRSTPGDAENCFTTATEQIKLAAERTFDPEHRCPERLCHLSCGRARWRGSSRARSTCWSTYRPTIRTVRS